MRRTANHGVAILLACTLASSSVAAQERLLTSRSVGGGAYVESVDFRDGGVPQVVFAGRDSVRVTRASQFLLPVSASTSLGSGWRLDVTAFYASGTVTYTDAAPGGVSHTARLAGTSDTRLRLAGRTLGDALTLTLGLNLPSGRSTLSSGEFSALRVLAAPALGMGSPPVGAGTSGTLGAVYGWRAGAWGMAAGAAYEHRGRYQPVAALVAGAPSSDFRPGAVMRASIGGERLVGAHRLNVAASADFFSEDRLRSALPAPDSSDTPLPPSLATVRLGPVFSGDAQLQLAAGRLREVMLYTSYLWRAAYARDGRTTAGSSGHYLAGGARTAVPLATRTDLVVAGEMRWQSGLAADEGLPTAGVRAANLTLGLSARRGLLTLQPYARAQAGTLRQKSLSGPGVSRPFAGIAAGIVLVSRY